ncbi:MULTISPECIES: GTPase/DUF3482 domain-containing protein [Vitreoscilla]|uniref:GTPase/DUF3482 domain-containing protein n=1 Tax=Vitreoscilla stercoraria TaxID=61 RepID=A0ABY4E979_VITST|nr:MULTISPECIES: GTPase/DUF3482 domain-containing protein [Vitreoscilla]AUZ04286.1 hypothetical protein ADP71_05020 [Vitreoscilla sp. C1]UOO91970.1 GTPase/DUF3482 domain-containing protein [Vitreoscilla stercoraria]
MKHLNIAVVGHTNTGKTSLLRTLLRDEVFGEVKNAPATTRHVQIASIEVDANHAVQLFDTPGLEDAGGLLDWLEHNTVNRLDGIERIEQFLQDAVARNEFAQEAKVLRQVLASDVSLYVIDAREPVVAKYKDELTVLSWCAKPVMPVFNFVQTGNAAAWHEMLARRSLHVHSQFDTVAFDFDSEMLLWTQLDILLNHHSILDILQTQRREQWHVLHQQAHELLAHFLMDVAAFVQTVQEHEPLEPVLANMQAKVRQREAHFQQNLLQLFRFYQQADLPAHWMAQAFSQNPFDAELLKKMGIRTSTGAAVGALVGLGVDAATLGLSGGLGAALGGMLGGVLSNAASISDKIKRIKTIHIDPATIVLLATRGKALMETLNKRGHASQHVLNLQDWEALWRNSRLPKPLKNARTHPQWSSLNQGISVQKAQISRQTAALELAMILEQEQVVLAQKE